MANHPDKETLKSFLSKVSLFGKADDSILSQLADKTEIITFENNQTIIQKGDIGETMYLIFSGRLKVHDGEHKVAELEKGGFFGELSLLDSEPRSMSVTALEKSVLGSINRNNFYEVLNKFPSVTKDIISALNKRLRNQNDVLISEFKSREAQLTELVKIRTNELEQKNQQLELTLDKLKRSQEQLVQSEKLASLGQLTAGIAHEIKNPLNFVNNFSALSKGLIEEIRESKNDIERNEVLSDLEINLQKINEHGKRADSIVKNMLEHSRTGKGSKIQTDINKLADEYFSLSFHGMAGNNPDFSCTLKKELASNLPQINAIQQDFSRVFVNLFNNAFYSVHQKKLSGNYADYVPVVSLKTILQDNSVIIKIADNGTGMPESVKDKIFQPFFTTKPTGQGTGLGLSLTHDIVKAHGGEIVVSGNEGEGAEFTITIPL